MLCSNLERLKMNSINSVHSYSNFKIQDKKQANQVSTPSFKGVIGNQVINQIKSNKTVTVAGVLALVAGVIGLSKDKVADVIESLIAEVKGLNSEKSSLNNEIQRLKNDAYNKDIESRAEFDEHERRLRGEFSEYIKSQNAEMAEKDAKIAELQKYEGMAKVKSLDEIDIITPQEVLTILDEMMTNKRKAQDSLLEFVLTGKGQEEFLAQVERNNKLLKAKKEGVTKIPEVNKKFEEVSKGDSSIGVHSGLYSAMMLNEVLRYNPKGDFLFSETMYKQILTNAKAIIDPISNNAFHNSANIVEDNLNSAKKFREDLLEYSNRLRDGYSCKQISETIDPTDYKISYRTFLTSGGVYREYSLSELAGGWFGCARMKDEKGVVLRNHSNVLK